MKHLLWMLLLCSISQAQVVGTYYADWSLSPVSSGITRIAPGQFPALSAYNLVVEFGDGNISATAPYYTVIGGGKDSTKYRYSDFYNPDGRWVPWQDSLSRTVHRYGGKILITVQAVDPTALKTIQADSAKTDIFCTTAAQYAKRRGLDGLEIDEEYWQSGPPPGDQLARFYRILRKRMDEAFYPGKGIVVLTTGRTALSTYSKVNKSDVDYVFFMLYDYQWVWSVPKNAALSYYFSPLNTPSGGSGTNAASIVSDGPAGWANAGWPKEKCVFGIPAYGFIFKGASALWETYSGYSELIMQSLPTALASGGVQGWDAVAQEPFISGTASKAFSVRTTGGGSYSIASGQKFFISFENKQSLQAKYDYITSQGFGGIFLYDVGGDVDASKPNGTYTPLHSALSYIVSSVTIAPSGTLSARITAVGVISGAKVVKFSWTSQNATSAKFNGSTVALQGSQTITIYSTQFFTLVLSGPGGSSTYTIKVTVSPKPPTPSPD